LIDSQMSFSTWCPPPSPIHPVDFVNIGRGARGRRRAGRTSCRLRPN
jgi:hypothetical protein